MPGPSDPGLLPSILYRIIDPQSRGTAARPGYSLEQMIQTIHDDVEKLLNTRRSVSHIGEKYPRVARVMGYGLPDVISLNALTDQQREEIGRLLEKIIGEYEPRLRDVHVSLKESDQADPLRIRFHMEGRLALDPAPEVAFDTTLELSSGHFIREDKG